jgi:DNA-binding transcriptional regulator YiaG
MARGDLAAFNIAGSCWKRFEKGLVPSAEATRQTMIGLRRDMKWSRATLAAVLGVSFHTVRRWEEGKKQPSGAARRLVWLISTLMGDPKRLTTGFSLLCWGKEQELQNFADCLAG